MEAMMAHNPLTPCEAIKFNTELCIRCNRCVDVCPTDVMVANPQKDEPPIVLYPDECWFCGCCVDHCPVRGAIRMEHPLSQRVGWKRKATGELFRIGMKNPPPPNTRPPVGGW